MDIYHERQRLQFCLLHALNNLLQGEPRFSRKDLDSIADGLQEQEDEENPKHRLSLKLFNKQHRNIFTGNYDANVLMAALSTRGYNARWHDKRRPISDSDLSDIAGVIANISTLRLLGLWKGRHWVALTQVNKEWYNMDSDLPAPVLIPDLRVMLKELLHQGAEVFFVTQVSKDDK